jgi:isoquinoline 1-oxidoreductase alpha subunit
VVKPSINGKPREFNLDDDVPLLWALRDEAQMTGTKLSTELAARLKDKLTPDYFA